MVYIQADKWSLGKSKLKETERLLELIQIKYHQIATANQTNTHSDLLSVGVQSMCAVKFWMRKIDVNDPNNNNNKMYR